MQKRIVDDIMNKWEAEENKASVDILKQLGIEGLTKKEQEMTEIEFLVSLLLNEKMEEPESKEPDPYPIVVILEPV